jgi:hypothetical protein
MSLMRIALRRAAVEALRGRTLVGDNVLDSEIGSIDIAADGTLRSDKEKPFIAVYTGDSKATKSNELRALVINGPTEIIFEIAVTAAMVETNEIGESVIVGMGTPAADANYEIHLDIVARQIADVLTDPENEWAEIFRKLTSAVLSVERTVARTADKTHLAAHQIRMLADLMADPARGAMFAPTHGLMMFLTKMEAGDAADADRDADMKDIAALMRAQIAGTAYAWQLDLRRYGMTREEADKLLITMQPGTEADVDIDDVIVAPAVAA